MESQNSGRFHRRSDPVLISFTDTFYCRSKRSEVTLEACLNGYCDACALDRRRSACFHCPNGRRIRNNFAEDADPEMRDEVAQTVAAMEELQEAKSKAAQKRVKDWEDLERATKANLPPPDPEDQLKPLMRKQEQEMLKEIARVMVGLHGNRPQTWFVVGTLHQKIWNHANWRPYLVDLAVEAGILELVQSDFAIKRAHAKKMK